jgi:hypothetical protein
MSSRSDDDFELMCMLLALMIAPTTAAALRRATIRTLLKLQ